MYAFKSAIADTMPGVYPEDVTINLILSLGADIDVMNVQFPTLKPTKKPNNRPVKDDDGDNDDGYYYAPNIDDDAADDDDNTDVAAPAARHLMKQKDSQSSLPSISSMQTERDMRHKRSRRLNAKDDDTPVATTASLGMGGAARELFMGTTPANPSGVAINYNVTVDVRALGFDDADLCYATLSTQLIDSITSGNFSSLIQAEAVNNGVTSILGNASSSESDFAILNYVRVFTGKTTNPPTSYPSATPSRPTTSPTSSPTKPPEPPHLYLEIVAGIVLTACSLALFYLTSIVIGALRSDVEVPKKNKTDMMLRNVSAADLEQKIDHDELNWDENTDSFQSQQGKPHIAV